MKKEIVRKRYLWIFFFLKNGNSVFKNNLFRFAGFVAEAAGQQRRKIGHRTEMGLRGGALSRPERRTVPAAMGQSRQSGIGQRTVDQRGETYSLIYHLEVGFVSEGRNNNRDRYRQGISENLRQTLEIDWNESENWDKTGNRNDGITLELQRGDFFLLHLVVGTIIENLKNIEIRIDTAKV